MRKVMAILGVAAGLGLLGAVAQDNRPAVMIQTNLSALVTVGAGTNAAPTLVATNWVKGARMTLRLENRSASDAVTVYLGTATNSPVWGQVPASTAVTVREFPVIDNGPVSCLATGTSTAVVHVHQAGTVR